MPSSFFSSIADKAQSAIGAHIPGRSSTGDGQSDSGPVFGSRTLESLHHQLKTFQQQYSSSTTPLQKIVTTLKGISIDTENVSRDTQAHSKELYLWGQHEDADIKDVTDRLGWLNFVHGSLAHTLSEKISASRAPLKALRDAETQLAPRLAVRTNLENQIARFESEKPKNQQQQLRLNELRIQLHKLEMEDETHDKRFELLKRGAIRESEEKKWEAIREYAEKVVLLSQAASSIIPVLPSIPPSRENPYTGAKITTNVRAAMQQALDQYRPNSLEMVLAEPSEADLQRSDTRSFGITHAEELSHIGSTDSSENLGVPSVPARQPSPSRRVSPPSGPPPGHGIKHTDSSASVQSFKSPEPTGIPIPQPTSTLASSPPLGTQSPPLNPAVLNQTPAPIPALPDSQPQTTPVVAPNPSEPSVKIPAALPTVAETGVPKTAGPDGPGPSSGSLLDLKSESKAPEVSSPPVDLPTYGSPASSAPQQYESAEDEKKRIAREERERILAGQSAQDTPGAGAPPPPVEDTQQKYESAEEEKKRLEREERERILRQGKSNAAGPLPGDDDLPPAEDLPPYEEF